MTVTLPHELRDVLAAAGDEPVRLTDPETNAEYVLLPAARFERLSPIEYDDGPLTAEEKRALLRHAGERAGWNDPEMDIYDELDPRRQP